MEKLILQKIQEVLSEVSYLKSEILFPKVFPNN